jgi:PAS domain S-box-containing protein
VTQANFEQENQENLEEKSLEKEYGRLTRRYKKLERDYRALSAIHEQTERLRDANEAAKELSNFYNRLLLKNTPAITFMIDLETRFVLGSEKTMDFLGYSDAREMVGVDFSTLFSKAMSDAWVSETRQRCVSVMRNKQALGYEEKVTPTNGMETAFQVTIAPAEENEDICRGAVVVMNDVRELLSAREAAERASVAKGAFLANMSHEMRTPMNAIIGMTSIAKSSADPERKDYCLQKIEDASTHLLGVINDILDMSKIEANKLELCFADFDFERMLQKVVNVINFKVDEKHQVFTVHIGKYIPRCLVGDDQRLAQVITTLLSNAVKFTPEKGSITLNARLLKEEDGVYTIQIEVTDSGIGISLEQQSRLFTSFEQAETGTSRKFGGTGLGLAISKRIVEMMGGTIWIESELGHGSTFAFTIQAQRGSGEQRSLLAPGVNWNTIRVLAVDDTPEIREHFLEIAHRLGLACDIAASGDEACEMIERNGSYDMYFVDWSMPGMDGVELSRQIREKGKGNFVITMISATEWSFIEKEARAAGVNKFLPKPLFPSSIADCINDCLATSAPETEPGVQEDGDARFEGRRILLAEDVEINREIVLALLEPTALTIDCAENGAEALRLFSANPDRYDVIFMDVQMPEMDGYEATRRIRALDAQEALRVPIIAMTANVFREDVEKCIAAGMNDHVGKPLDFDEVLDKLRRYLPH